MVPDDPDATLWYREWTVDARRYVVAFDTQRYHLEDTVQAKAVQDTEMWMATKNTELAAAKRSRQRETLGGVLYLIVPQDKTFPSSVPLNMS